MQWIGDTKHFLRKPKQIFHISKNTYLITIDVESLYTNTDHEEGAEANRIKLGSRENKDVPLSVLKNSH